MDSNNKNCKGVLFIKLISLNVEDKTDMARIHR